MHFKQLYHSNINVFHYSIGYDCILNIVLLLYVGNYFIIVTV
jgi:hypothetical protein